MRPRSSTIRLPPCSDRLDAMNLQTLLGATSTAQFVAEHFHRLPFSSAGAAKSVIPLGSWDTLAEILRGKAVDLLVVRDGQQYAGPDPQSLKEAQSLSTEGYTIVVRHAERHHDGLRDLAASFELDFDAPV